MTIKGHVGVRDGYKRPVSYREEQGSYGARQGWASPAREGHREQQHPVLPCCVWEQILSQMADPREQGQPWGNMEQGTLCLEHHERFIPEPQGLCTSCAAFLVQGQGTEWNMDLLPTPCLQYCRNICTRVKWGHLRPIATSVKLQVIWLSYFFSLQTNLFHEINIWG